MPQIQKDIAKGNVQKKMMTLISLKELTTMESIWNTRAK
jgi:hypothetical protein